MDDLVLRILNASAIGEVFGPAVVIGAAIEVPRFVRPWADERSEY